MFGAIDGKGANFLGAMLTGVVSRSSYTAKVHRLLRDGKVTESDFDAVIASDSDKILSRQRNFAYVSGGQLDWLDIIRPIAEYFEGFEGIYNRAFEYKTNNNSSHIGKASLAENGVVGPVTRWFRTNTFYRKPVVSGRIKCTGSELAKIMPKIAENSIIFLLSPYSLATLIENRFYDHLEDLAKDYAKAIAKSTPKLREKGYACILLLEPFVGFNLSGPSYKLPDWFCESISLAKTNEMKLGINFPKAEAEEVVPIVEDSRVDFVGIDLLYSTGFKVKSSKDLLLGAVEGDRARVESLDNIRHLVNRFLGCAVFSGSYYIGPNDRLYDVPFDFALGKIEILSKLLRVC